MVLLLHGFPQSSAEWKAQLEVLAKAGYHAVAPNQRGYSPGARPAGVEAYRIEQLVSDVLGMADALGAETFHLVGHDWGAIVAWHVAAQHPARLRSLTIVSVPHPNAFARALDPANATDQPERSTYIASFEQEGAEGRGPDVVHLEYRRSGARTGRGGVDEGVRHGSVSIRRDRGRAALVAGDACAGTQ